MLKWVLIAVGGAFGSVLRYALQGGVQRLTGGAFPTGTLAVNVLGCFVLGALAGYFSGPQLVREEYRIGLTIGVLGGFTTFSTFGLGVVQSDRGRRIALGAGEHAVELRRGAGGRMARLPPGESAGSEFKP